MATATTIQPKSIRISGDQLKLRRMVSEMRRKGEDEDFMRYYLSNEYGYTDESINSELYRGQTGTTGGQGSFQQAQDTEKYTAVEDKINANLGTGTIKQRYESLKNLNSQLQQYKSLVDSTTGKSGTNLTGEDAALIKSAHANLLTTMSAAEGQGALQEADKRVIMDMIPDPTSFTSAFGTAVRGGKKGTMGAIDSAIQRANNAFDLLVGQQEPDVREYLMTGKVSQAEGMQQRQQQGALTPVTLNSPEEAASWLQSNPNDPRAGQVRQKLESINYDFTQKVNEAQIVDTTKPETAIGGVQQQDMAQLPPEERKKSVLEKVGNFLGMEKFGNAIGTAYFLNTKEGKDLQKKAESGDENALSTLNELLDSAGTNKEVLGSAAMTGVNALAGGAMAGVKTVAGKAAALVGTGYASDVAGKAEQGKEDILAPGVGTAIGTVASAFPAFKALKDAKLPDEARKAVGQIIQGKTKDIEPALRALSSIDTRGVKTYKELTNKITENVANLGKVMDNVLSQDTTKRVISDLDKVVNVGGKEVRTNSFAQAVDNLAEMYDKINDPVKAQTMRNLAEKASTEGVTLKEMNDIAKRYTTEFGKKAFSATTGEPLTSVNAQAFENTRKGIKETVRSFLPDDSAKRIDKELSDSMNTRMLTEKMIEKVNSLEQTLVDRGIIEKIGRGASKIVDTVTMHGARGLVGGMLQSNVGNAKMNSKAIEEAISGNLKVIEKLNKNINNKKFVDKLKKAGKITSFQALLNAAREIGD